MIIVTSGRLYIDIDAYAGCIAYAELLQLQGIESKAVSLAPLNESITPTVRSWGGELLQEYHSNDEDQFALIDVSAPDAFDSFVDLDQVKTVIDHHPGHEEYWQSRLGDDAVIEFIGAACTQIYERWVAAGLADRISPLSARLLMTGILDNTLNFRAAVTTDRDHQAYAALSVIAGLTQNWPADYFSECQRVIEADLAAALRADTKHLSGTHVMYPGIPEWVGQLVVWNAADLLRTQKDTIHAVMSEFDDAWLVNIVSIEEGVSYIMAEDDEDRASIAGLLHLPPFKDGYTTADRLWLRKEILKASLEWA